MSMKSNCSKSFEQHDQPFFRNVGHFYLLHIFFLTWKQVLIAVFSWRKIILIEAMLTE